MKLIAPKHALLGYSVHYIGGWKKGNSKNAQNNQVVHALAQSISFLASLATDLRIPLPTFRPFAAV
jgi:hypothetical protein